ncbi:MAG: RNA-binding S4 domain-containing protein [Clostridiales bacterium]|nr:RNA-binding S4 domain-containing protein [Clostridiales bacterium]
MRIDKFLKNSRIIKRRTVAKEACEQGRIFLNEKTAKPGAEVKAGDIIFIQFGNGSLKVEVAELKESCRKEAAADMYRVIE